jgi:F-box/WD-40 domain protein 8
MMSEDLEEILKFRSEWKKELENSRKTSNGNSKDNSVLQQEQQKDYSPECEHDSLVTQDERDLERSKNDVTRTDRILSLNLSHKEKSDSDKKVPGDCQPKELVLLSLPNPDAKEKQNSNESYAKKQRINKSEEENLLELLIADIDEITVIPFFDLQLPREIGLKIFRSLSIQDLCQCASVSKSWRNLAEDELLWFNLGVKLGFVGGGETAISDHVGWKGFVHESVIEQRHLRSRWKERICRIDAMEYERGEKEGYLKPIMKLYRAQTLNS